MAEEEPKSPFNEEQVTSLKQLVSGIVNSAIRTRDQMVDKKRAEDREAVKADFAKLLDEKLSTLKPADPEPPGKDGKRSKGEDLEFSTMRKQLADTNERIAASEKREAEARARLEASELRDRVSKILAPSGIEGTRFRGAFALIKDRIRKQSDEADAPYVFVDDAGDEVELEPGLKSWIKGDEAKIFVPPSGAGGSGSRRVVNPLGKNEKKETTFEDVGNAVLELVSPFGARTGQ